MNYQYVLGGDHVFVLFVVVKFTKESSLLMKNKHMIFFCWGWGGLGGGGLNYVCWVDITNFFRISFSLGTVNKNTPAFRNL